MSGHMTTQLILLAFTGAIGTLSRYFLGNGVYTLLGTDFPYGTLVVNSLGCLIIGFIGTLADEYAFLTSENRFIIFVGLLGAFTTFSSFAYETWILFKNGQTLSAGVNVMGTLGVCFLGLILGVSLARLFS